MNIYNPDGTICIRDLIVDDNSFRSRQIMGDHNLTLYFSLAEHVEIPVGAYCEYQGERYTLMRPENLKKKHSRSYEYTVTFESQQAGAKIWKFQNPVDGRVKFPLTAKPVEHLDMFVENMNRRSSVVWVRGDCVEGVEHLICYDHDYCWEALSKMAQEFNTEFEISAGQDASDNLVYIVSLHKVEYDKSNPLPLSYGKGNGFKSGVGRTSEETPPVEYLFVQGGTDNIDASKYGNAALLLPKEGTLGYDGEHFEDEQGYNASNARTYQSDSRGLCIFRSDAGATHISHAEDSLECEDIYPKRVGVVGSVVVVDETKHIYDIIDASPSTMPNFEDYLIGGETMTIVFQSGELAGREFDVKYHNEDKRFEIVPQEIDGILMPSSSFIPSVGDEYVVFNCTLPQEYINAYDEEEESPTKSGAEWDMMRAAIRYLYDNEDEKFTFTGTLDGIWAKKDWANIGGKIRLGGFVNFSDTAFHPQGILVRIVGLKDYINKPYMPEIELSNKTASAGFSAEFKTISSQTDVEIEEAEKNALAFTKRRFRDAQETIEMLNELIEVGFGDFSESINPVTVQTMQALVGDESLQFRFARGNETNPTVLTDITPIFGWNGNTKVFSVRFSLAIGSAPYLQHYTLGIKDMKPTRDTAEMKLWRMSFFTSGALLDGNKRYYLYAKVGRDTTTGTFELTETAYGMESVSGYYYLLVGILSSEYEGSRSFVPLYGFTEILPNRITTDRLVSGNGNSYFDLLNNAFKLGDLLQFNVNNSGKLVLKGTLVQSQNGSDESPLGCFRGEYSQSTTYYEGDEVTYTLSGNTSTYRYISSTPSSGNVPTDTLYWQVVAMGARGNDGTSLSVKDTCYNHFTDEAEWELEKTTDEPIVLIDESENPDTQELEYHIYWKYGRPRPGWAPGWRRYVASIGDAFVMESDGHLWMAREEGWSDIGQFTGAQGEAGQSSYLYIRYSASPNGQNMSTTPNKYIGYCVTNSSTAPSSPSSYVWAKWQGDDGFGYEYIYTRTQVPTRPATPTGQQTDGNVPSGWTGSPTGVDETNQYEWISVRKKDDGVWSAFSTPSLWAKFGADGIDADFTEFRYGVSSSTIAPPALVNNVREPSGWTTEMPTIGALQYLWLTKALISGTDGALIGTWSAPVRISAQDGAAGESPSTIFRGVYDNTKTYYGNQYRVDVVKYSDTYYRTLIDAPYGDEGFSRVEPTNTEYWTPFGGSFDSVATELLLAENANIAGWVFKDGKLQSQATLEDGTPMAYLDGESGEMRLKGTVQLATTFGNFISLSEDYSGYALNSNIICLHQNTECGEADTINIGYTIGDIGKVLKFWNSTPANGSGRRFTLVSPTFKIKDVGGGQLQSVVVGEDYITICPSEIIELTCFELPITDADRSEGYMKQGKWVLTGRNFNSEYSRYNLSADDLYQSASKGRMPKVLAMGKITGNGGNPTIEYKMWDGSTPLSVSAVSTWYRVSFADGTFPTNYRVFVTGRTGNDTSYSAAVGGTTNTFIDIAIWQKSGSNKWGDVDFIIYDYSWWINASELGIGS